MPCSAGFGPKSKPSAATRQPQATRAVRTNAVLPARPIRYSQQVAAWSRVVWNCESHQWRDRLLKFWYHHSFKPPVATA
jgi:hypothetical protein